MSTEYPYNIKVKFPGDLDYIPAIRKFVHDVLQVSGFTNKFAFRSEIIVDEICNNAVNFGCESNESEVELACQIFQDRIEFLIKDQGKNKLHIERLKNVIQQKDATENPDWGLGLDIVRMLSEKVDIKVDQSNVTTVHVVRKREMAEKQK
ncbi:ATP-binding protein [Chitinispirillales bacterium ANBcel5]|uniref:ATP-binding protein n=1 Tax=Cellulosispirillum alkaliphilum TaxID=3039283 RepID=UPI002A58BA76|nr:ATP-binding protein [Chitinispirillales bacterium ANBcel5]